jgi:putative heme-binding domain-containing protein
MIVEMIGKRGNAADLAYIYQQALKSDGLSAAVRRKAIDALVEAGLTRQMRPEGDLSQLGTLIQSWEAKRDEHIELGALRLAGLWKLGALEGALSTLAQASGTSEPVRAAALDALAAIGSQSARARIEALAAAEHPAKVRLLAVAALAGLDLDAAADRAVAVLRAANPAQDFTPLLAAFLNRQGGAEKLASVLAKNTLPADSAKLALRAVYALGRADAGLVAELSRAAGLNAEIRPLEKADLDRLMADVATQGNPERGEAVFRRAELNCTKCHALAGAGGGVGPDLSPLGASSPVDYIINSIMLPDQAIKEEFQTKVVLTNDGRVYHGIVADKDNKRLVLKEATGDMRVIPTADIEDSKEGGSLMPKGLANLMTRSEFVDLVRFLSELGKPGPYAIHTSPTIQRWRLLKPVAEPLAHTIPDPETFRAQVLGAEPDHWVAAYALVSGGLPLQELSAEAGSQVVYLRGEIDVSSAGPLTFRITSPGATRAWVDEKAQESGGTITAPLAAGRHKLTLRVDTRAPGSRPLKVEVVKPSGSPAEFAVVGGR